MSHGQVPLLGRHARQTKELRQRIRHRRPGEVVVDGLRLVQDLVRWGLPIHELYLAEGSCSEPAVAALAAAADQTWQVPAPVLGDLAPTRHSQGVLAVVAEPQPIPWTPAGATTIFLDGVQDPGNVGAIVRCAAALGADAVLLAPGCADPFHPAAVRGAAGAVLQLPLFREVEIGQVAAQTRAAGGQVWAAAAAGMVIDAWRPQPPVLLVLGAEGAGVGAAALAVATGQVTISLARRIESLNVAVAAGILLQELRRYRP